MKKLLIAAACGAILTTGAIAPAFAQAPAAAPAAGKLSADSTVKALIDNPKSKPILEKYVPIIVQYADMIPDLDKTSLRTLGQQEQVQTMGGLTPEVMKTIEAELAKL